MTSLVTIAAVVAAEDGLGRPHEAAAVARALACEGGHLMVGHGGYTIHHAQGWLSGSSPDTVKRVALAVGLPVIDTRQAPFEAAARIAASGPTVAVGRDPGPAPYDAFSYAPLAHVAALYRRAGAEVRNVPACHHAPGGGRALPPPSTATARHEQARGSSPLRRVWDWIRARLACRPRPRP